MATASAPSSPKAEDIGDDEIVARCLLYQQFFDGDRLAESALFKFNDSKTADGFYEESLIWRRFTPTEADVHAVGCAIAANQNAGRGEPLPGDERRRYYCGFSEGKVEDFRIENDRFRAEVVHQEENGVKAHTNLRLFLKVTTKIDKAQARSEAGLLLARALGTPHAHICDCDKDDPHQPITKHGAQCLDRAA